MDCPQCGAEVPADDAFCGKCGYAMRDQAPQRVDQSRIRVHEEPAPAADEPEKRPPSQQRVRKHTVMGMPSLTPATGVPQPKPSPGATPPEPPPPPPTEISSARARSPRRTPQKTMLGIPRADFPEPMDEPPAVGPGGAGRGSAASVEQLDAPPGTASPSHRARARVRYDSADEPFPVVQRRKNALRVLAVLVLCSGAWLAYRYMTLHG